MTKIDPQFFDLVESGGQDVSFDPLAKVLPDAELAAYIGHDHVESLKTQTAVIDARVAGIYKKIAADAEKQTLAKGARVEVERGWQFTYDETGSLQSAEQINP
jgi:hypothetical protein